MAYGSRAHAHRNPSGVVSGSRVSGRVQRKFIAVVQLRVTPPQFERPDDTARVDAALKRRLWRSFRNACAVRTPTRRDLAWPPNGHRGNYLHKKSAQAKADHLGMIGNRTHTRGFHPIASFTKKYYAMRLFRRTGFRSSLPIPIVSDLSVAKCDMTACIVAQLEADYYFRVCKIVLRLRIASRCFAQDDNAFWDGRESNPDALSGCRFSHHYGFRHRGFAFVVRTVP